MQEKRKFSRVPLNMTTMLFTANRQIPVETRNISLKGVLIEAEQPLPELSDEPCRVEFSLTGEISFSVDAELVHTEGSQRGFRFKNMDTTALTHLRSIVEHNAENPDAVTAELPFLID